MYVWKVDRQNLQFNQYFPQNLKYFYIFDNFNISLQKFLSLWQRVNILQLATYLSQLLFVGTLREKCRSKCYFMTFSSIFIRYNQIWL